MNNSPVNNSDEQISSAPQQDHQAILQQLIDRLQKPKPEAQSHEFMKNLLQ
jgi:hypothetical protein